MGGRQIQEQGEEVFRPESFFYGNFMGNQSCNRYINQTQALGRLLFGIELEKIALIVATMNRHLRVCLRTAAFAVGNHHVNMREFPEAIMKIDPHPNRSQQIEGSKQYSGELLHILYNAVKLQKLNE
jgi:hypothetical protein